MSHTIRVHSRNSRLRLSRWMERYKDAVLAGDLTLLAIDDV
jgi:hypothetical protein